MKYGRATKAEPNVDIHSQNSNDSFSERTQDFNKESSGGEPEGYLKRRLGDFQKQLCLLKMVVLSSLSLNDKYVRSLFKSGCVAETE